MAGGKRTGVLEFCIPVKYSGVYEFWIQSASVRDWLRLWSKKLLITDKKVQVLSVPLVHQAEEWIPPAQLASGGDSDQHSQKRGGDDGSEVFEVRAYRDGDPLQRVHWKLTAKTGEMLVREFSLPKREVLLLQVDLYHPPQENEECLVVVMDDRYYYDEKGYLRSEQRDVRKLFHQLSRAKEELALVVKGNTTVYAVLLNLLQGRK